MCINIFLSEGMEQLSRNALECLFHKILLRYCHCISNERTVIVGTSLFYPDRSEGSTEGKWRRCGRNKMLDVSFKTCGEDV